MLLFGINPYLYKTHLLFLTPHGRFFLFLPSHLRLPRQQTCLRSLTLPHSQKNSVPGSQCRWSPHRALLRLEDHRQATCLLLWGHRWHRKLFCPRNDQDRRRHPGSFPLWQPVPWRRRSPDSSLQHSPILPLTSFQDVFYGIRNKTRQMADQHADLGRTINSSIVQHLQKLFVEIKAHLKVCLVLLAFSYSAQFSIEYSKRHRQTCFQRGQGERVLRTAHRRTCQRYLHLQEYPNESFSQSWSVRPPGPSPIFWF